MSTDKNITTLKSLTCDLLKDTLRQIRSHREQHSPTNEERFRIPEYLLEESLQYVSGAWDLIQSDRPQAAVTLSRWVVEASLNLFWVVAGMTDQNDDVDDRLKALYGEALRCDANLCDGLKKLWPGQADLFSNRAAKAREVRKDLGVTENLQSLETRLVNLTEQLYPIYRMCCAAAHPGLKVWERFGADGSTGHGSPIDSHTACWMAAQSSFHLVVGAYILTKLEVGDKEALQSWWNDKVGPLLDSVK
jgi:hypothetical protein